MVDDARPLAGRTGRAIVGTSDGHLPAVASEPPRKEHEMAWSQPLRVDAFGLLPSLLIVLMLVLAMLGIVAHAGAM